MKVMIKVSPIFALLIMVVSCATTPRVLPEKYNLGNYLEEVNQISTFRVSDRVSDWENVDNQSVILRVNRNDYYLLVLRRPINFTAIDLTLDITNTASRDKAVSAEQKIGPKKDNPTGIEGYFTTVPQNIAGISSGSDMIVARDNTGLESFYVIEKIYKLKGKEQAEQIKEWLRTH